LFRPCLLLSLLHRDPHAAGIMLAPGQSEYVKDGIQQPLDGLGMDMGCQAIVVLYDRQAVRCAENPAVVGLEQG